MELQESVIFEKESRTYAPGEAITGAVILVNRNLPQKVKGLALKFEGSGVAATKGKTEGRKCIRISTAPYFNHDINILGNDGEETTIEEGIKFYHFQCILPTDLPSSYRGSTHAKSKSVGHVTYHVSLVLTFPGEEDAQERKERFDFFVTGYLDLNYYPNTKQQVVLTKSKQFRFLFSKGNVRFDFKMLKRGFVGGDTILFEMDIHNNSRRTVTATVSVLRRIQFKVSMDEPVRAELEEVCSVEGPSVFPGADELWIDDSLRLPLQIPPTNLGGNCRLLDISYSVKAKLNYHGCFNSHSVLESGTTIIVGTVKFRPTQEGNVVPILPIQDQHLSEDPPPAYDCLFNSGLPENTE